MIKVCSRCEFALPLEKFHKHAKGALGHRPICKACEAQYKRADYQKRKKVYAERSHRTYMKNREKRYVQARSWQQANKARASEIWHDAHLRREYGITLDDYRQMLAMQNFGCAICGAGPSPKRRLSVDHDHKTGKVRGLLCGKCNSGLGFFKENVGIVDSLKRYVLAHSGR